MIDLSLILLLAFHLLAVNLAGAGPLICLWFDWRELRGDAAAGPIGRTLARRSFEALIVGGVLGLALLGVLWLRYPRAYFDGWRAVTVSRLWFLIPEYCFSLALMVVYWATWNGRHRWVWGHRLLNLIGSTNLLYHFPTQFVVIGLLCHQPALRDAPYKHLALVTQPEALAALAHHLLASLAVTGVWLMGSAARMARQSQDHSAAGRLSAFGARLALAPTLAQIMVGLWYLWQLPQRMRAEMLGDQIATTTSFGAAVLCSLGLMHHLAGAAWGDIDRRQTVRAGVLLALTVGLMSAARHGARRPYFEQVESTAAARATSPGN